MSDSTNPKNTTDPVQGEENLAPPTGYATVVERRFDGSFISGAGNDIFYFNDSFVYGVGDVRGDDFYVIGQYQIGNINLNDVTGDNRVYFDDDFVINYARISGQGLILGYDNGIGGYSELRVRDANTRYKFYLGNNDTALTVTQLITDVGVTHAPVGTPTKTLTAGGIFDVEDTSLITASTDFGVTLLGGIGLDVFTLGFSQNGTLNGRAGADYYYLTRFQESTSLNLRDTEGSNHFIVEAGVAIADVDDSGEAIILDLANGGEIRIAGGLTKYSFHIGDLNEGTVTGQQFLDAYKDVGLSLIGQTLTTADADANNTITGNAEEIDIFDVSDTSLANTFNLVAGTADIGGTTYTLKHIDGYIGGSGSDTVQVGAGTWAFDGRNLFSGDGTITMASIESLSFEGANAGVTTDDVIIAIDASGGYTHTLTQSDVDNLTAAGIRLTFAGAGTIYQENAADPVTDLKNAVRFGDDVELLIDIDGTEYTLNRHNFDRTSSAAPTLTAGYALYTHETGRESVAVIQSDQAGVSYSITDNRFTISEDGVISLTGALFTTANASYTLGVVATNEFGVTDTITATIVVNNQGDLTGAPVGDADNNVIEFNANEFVDGGAGKDVADYSQTTTVNATFFAKGTSDLIIADNSIEYVALTDVGDTALIAEDLPYILVGQGGNDIFTINGILNVTIWGDDYQSITSAYKRTSYDNIADGNLLTITGATNTNTFSEQSILPDGWRSFTRDIDGTPTTLNKDDYGLILSKNSGTGTAINVYDDSSRITGTVNFTATANVAETISGPASGFGRQIALGDINGDGRLDLIATSPASANALTIIYGDSTGDPFDTAENRVTLTGSPAAGYSTYAFSYISSGYQITPKFLAVGDINGDGFDDIIVSDTLGFREEPTVQAHHRFDIIFGRSDDISSKITETVSGTMSVRSNTIQDESGVFSILGGSHGVEANFIGDINGDGRDDFAFIGSQTSNPTGGTIRIVYGDADFNSSVKSETDTSATTRTSSGTNLLTNSAFDTSLLRIFSSHSNVNPHDVNIKALGDINKDGTDDFAVASHVAGVIYVIYGNTDEEDVGKSTTSVHGGTDIWRNFFRDDYDGSAGFVIHGRAYSTVSQSAPVADGIGLGLTGIGDFDGDGINDFAFTENRNPGTSTVSSIAEDAIYIVFGKDSREEVNSQPNPDFETFDANYSVTDLVSNNAAARIALPDDLLAVAFDARRNGDVGTVNYYYQLGGLGDIDNDGKDDLGLRTSDGDLHIIYGHDLSNTVKDVLPLEIASGSNADEIILNNAAGEFTVDPLGDGWQVTQAQNGTNTASKSLAVEKLTFSGDVDQIINLNTNRAAINAGDGDDIFKFSGANITSLENIKGGEGTDRIETNYGNYNLGADLEHIFYNNAEDSSSKIRLHKDANQTVEFTGEDANLDIYAFDSDFDDADKGAHTFIFGDNSNRFLNLRSTHESDTGGATEIFYNNDETLTNGNTDDDDKIFLNFTGNLTYTLQDAGTELLIHNGDITSNDLHLLFRIEIHTRGYTSNDFNPTFTTERNTRADIANFNFVDAFEINTTNSRVFDANGNRIIINTDANKVGSVSKNIGALPLTNAAPPQTPHENNNAAQRFELELQLDNRWNGQTFTFSDGDTLAFTENGRRISEPEFVQALEAQNIIAEFAEGNTIFEFADNKSITIAKDYSASDKNKDGMINHDEIQEFVDALANTHLEFA